MSPLIHVLSVITYPGMLFVLVFGLLWYGIHRKLAARMQSRIGPPVWQPFFDALKLFGKESIVPDNARTGYTAWPVVALASALVTGLLIPMAGITLIEVPGSFLFIIYFLVLAALSMYLAGFASSNPYSSAGSARGIIQMLGYEFPLVASMLVPLVYLGTMSVRSVSAFQAQSVLPWLGFSFPLAAIAYFAAVAIKVELPPFHIPEAHQEIVSGYSTEYSGFRLALLELTKSCKLFVLIALGVALFLGGSVTGIAGFTIFIIKSLGVLAVLTVARVIFARLRIEHAIKYGWLFGFIALVDLVRVMVI